MVLEGRWNVWELCMITGIVGVNRATFNCSLAKNNKQVFSSMKYFIITFIFHFLSIGDVTDFGYHVFN